MKVSFFASNYGRCYVENFIDNLTAKDRGAIVAVLKDIELYGLSAVGCQFRQIEGKLWEIKIKAPNGGYRIFYVMVSSEEMMCLHAYKKQGQKAPQKELDVARKRLKEVLS
jgi:phage-related protein